MNPRLTQLLPAIALVAGFLAASLWPGHVTTVILVRHAEKSATPADDPLLTSVGSMRAMTLSRMLKDAGIDIIISSQYQRTRATVAPLADVLDLEPVIFQAQEQEKLIAAIRDMYRGRTIIISGHSNTVPGILADLGVSAPPEITEDQYDNLFIVHLYDSPMRSSARMTVLQIEAGGSQ